MAYRASILPRLPPLCKHAPSCRQATNLLRHPHVLLLRFEAASAREQDRKAASQAEPVWLHTGPGSPHCAAVQSAAVHSPTNPPQPSHPPSVSHHADAAKDPSASTSRGDESKSPVFSIKAVPPSALQPLRRMQSAYSRRHAQVSAAGPRQ